MLSLPLSLPLARHHMLTRSSHAPNTPTAHTSISRNTTWTKRNMPATSSQRAQTTSSNKHATSHAHLDFCKETADRLFFLFLSSSPLDFATWYLPITAPKRTKSYLLTAVYVFFLLLSLWDRNPPRWSGVYLSSSVSVTVCLKPVVYSTVTSAAPSLLLPHSLLSSLRNTNVTFYGYTFPRHRRVCVVCVFSFCRTASVCFMLFLFFFHVIFLFFFSLLRFLVSSFVPFHEPFS